MRKFEIRNWLTLELDKAKKPAFTENAINEFWEIDERTENLYRLQFNAETYPTLKSA